MFAAKYRGYDMNLYRSYRQRWVSGVCGGIAENMGWSANGVRLATIILFFFMGPLVVFAYITAVVLLANARYAKEQVIHDGGRCRARFALKRGRGKWQKVKREYQGPINDAKQQWQKAKASMAGGEGQRSSADYEAEQPNLKDRVFYKGDLSAARVDQIRQRLRQVDQRIRDLETHVTSTKYQFDRELNR